MTPGTPHYFDGFDMEGRTTLRVEARLPEVPPHPAATASVHVEGTDNAGAEGKSWVLEGHAIELFPGTWERRTFYGVRPRVRVVAMALGPDRPSRIEIRLTRMP